MNNTKMLYYDRIEVSEGIDVDKTSKWRECDICLYWYFLNKGFKFKPNVSRSLSIISGIEVILLMENADLTEKSRTF